MAELVDATDLKSVGHCGCAGSNPARGTYLNLVLFLDFILKFENDTRFSFCDVYDKIN